MKFIKFMKFMIFMKCMKIMKFNKIIKKVLSWVDGWVGGRKSRFMDRLQQSKIVIQIEKGNLRKQNSDGSLGISILNFN